MAEPREVVGREEELELLSAFARGEGPRVLLLEGEAGIGKTTLLREAVAAASGAGARVLMGRPAAAEAALAFSGLGDLLGEALDPVVAELPRPQAAALEIALLRRQAEGRQVDLHTVSAGLLSALRALAADEPVVVAVDDVQWLDRETMGSLAFAFRRLSDERVRLIASLRLGDVPTPPELIGSLPREEVVRVAIRSLSPAALDRAIRIHPDRTLPRPVLERIHELTGGNPFYALEIVRSLPPADLSASFRMPRSLEALTVERLGRLPDPVRRLLEPRRPSARSHSRPARGAFARTRPGRRTSRRGGRRRRGRGTRRPGLLDAR